MVLICLSQVFQVLLKISDHFSVEMGCNGKLRRNLELSTGKGKNILGTIWEMGEGTEFIRRIIKKQ